MIGSSLVVQWLGLCLRFHCGGPPQDNVYIHILYKLIVYEIPEVLP